MASRPIQLGFIGLSATGWAAASLAPPLFNKTLSSKYSLVAVSTTNPQSAQASAEKYAELASKAAGTKVAVKPYHGSAERIASDEDVDMVVVAVKVTNHKETAIKVIEAGKDLFVEFPAGRRLAETRELYEAATKKGIKTMVGLQTRFANYALKAKSILDGGELGKVLSSSVSISFGSILWGPIIDEPHKYILDAYNGATLLDIGGGHAIDLFIHTLGPISSLSAVMQNQLPSSALVDSSGNPTEHTVPNDSPTQICVSGLTRNGAAFNFHFQSVKEPEFSWTIYGENGTLRIRDSNPMKSGTFDISPEVHLNGNKIELMPESLTSQTGLAWEAYADGKTGEYADLEQALKVKEILDAIWRSAKDGKRIDL